MKVTFDSNVWRIVVSLYNFQKEIAWEDFRMINDAIIQGKVKAFLSEMVFTIEGIMKTQRKQFFTDYKPETINEERLNPDGSINLSIGIGPNPNVHPGNTSILTKHWDDAKRLGFKLLCCPRVAMVKNPDLESEWFVPVNHDISERFGACGREIEAHGCGLTQLKGIVKKYAHPSKPWHTGFSKVPDSERNSIAKAVAEWADGDTVAAHYAYGNDYLCTRDSAKNTRNNSVFSAANRTWLEQKYGIKFVTPEELANLV